jgi:hypothetical protein
LRTERGATFGPPIGIKVRKKRDKGTPFGHAGGVEASA